MRVEIQEHGSSGFLAFCQWLLTHKEDYTMSQVQFSAMFSVTAPASTLAVTPATGSFSLTVGTPVPTTTVAVVSGGVPPYTYALDAASGPLPTGVTFAEDNNGNISLTGTPTVAGTSTTPVLLDINDSATPPASAKLTLKPIA
jgi:hypothetical protein